MSLTKVTYSMIQGATVNVLDYIPKAEHDAILNYTSTFDCTSNLATALASIPSDGGTLYFPPGLFRGWISVQRSNVSIVGAGSAATILKLPDGASETTLSGKTGAPIVVEFGLVDWPSYPLTEYTNLELRNLTVDGNRANCADPALTDVLGWGFANTNCPNTSIDNVVFQNCWAGGVGHFILSDYSRFSNIYIKNCGYTAYAGGQHGFDVNSCNNSTGNNIVIDTCKYGARVLDNCSGNDFDFVIVNAVQSGLNYGTGVTNIAKSNNITAMIVGGCGDYGASLGSRIYSSQITIVAKSLVGPALYVTPEADPTLYSVGNIINVSSSECDKESAIIYQGPNSYCISSYKDYRNAASGFAVELWGSNNTLEVAVADSSVSTLRGIRANTGATKNLITSFSASNLLQSYDTLASTKTTIARYGVEDATTGAGQMFLPVNGVTLLVVGTTTVTSISPEGNDGRQINIFPVSGFQINHSTGTSGAINLSGGVNYTIPANTCLTLVCVGIQWFEVTRS